LTSGQKLDLLLPLHDFVDTFHQMVVDMLHLPQWHGQMPQAPCLGTMVQNDWLKYGEIP
jgi:hypothetical protein